jgi:hypothetical protein
MRCSSTVLIIIVVDSVMTQSGNFWIHPRTVFAKYYYDDKIKGDEMGVGGSSFVAAYE